MFGQNGYVAYRRELRLPAEFDFEIQPMEFIAFRLWRRARSKAASGHCVILAVTRTMYGASARGVGTTVGGHPDEGVGGYFSVPPRTVWIPYCLSR